ncbi:MAG: 50S ribosomal protein L4 [Gammaproteobacteria bacterium]
MDLNLHSYTKGSVAGNVTVSDSFFGEEYNEGLIHQVLTAYSAGSRAGSKANKSRSDVRGGGIKPWRQKGTGRARAGTSRSPIWRSGGVTFAARTRNYSQKVNRKMYRKAISSIFSELVRLERLHVVDSFDVAEPKTKALISCLNKLNVGNDVLIITEEISENLYLASRNLYHVGVVDVEGMDPISLVGFGSVIISEAAINSLEAKYS